MRTLERLGAAIPVRRRRMLAAVLLAPLAARSQVPAATPGKVDLAATRAAIEAWLVQAGLSPQLEVHALQWRNQSQDANARWLVLELNFRGGKSDMLEEMAATQALMESFHKRTGTPLPDALQYRLVHAARVPRALAHVTVGILDDSYAVVRNPTTGAWQFGPDTARQTRVVALLPASAQPYSQRLPTALPVSLALDASLAARVQRQLADYFKRAGTQAGRPAPRLTLIPLLEASYAGLEVVGLRKLVIPERDLWEKLQVSVELHADGTGTRAVCYLDGAWATGLGSTLPADADYHDMEKDYRGQLQRFGQALLSDLQTGLSPRGAG